MSPPPSPPPSSSVQVVVRLRPMNEKEKKHGTLPVVTASTQERTVTIIKGQGARQVRNSFSFDHVFTAFSSQEEVFEETLKPVIGDVLKGYESTVFAYGQTGTGKTHTMEGDLSTPEMQGVIPRSAQAIFERLKQPQYSEYNVTCSYLEIYNEELCDLLVDDDTNSTSSQSSKKLQSSSNSNSSRLEIMEGKNGTFCRGLTEKTVSSANDVLNLMQAAQNQRKIGETKMNKHSSRSHCIFTMRVQAKVTLVDNSTMEFNGKLHMVDLAGSECAKTAGLGGKGCIAEAARERERLNINRSLLTLGRVISLLKEQSSSKKAGNIRIPYRDSKLTRILQESLGGRCKTVVIATLSPAISAIEESFSTLNYAQSANGIVNKPIATSYLSVAPGGTHHSSKMLEVDMTRGSGDGQGGVEYWQEMECRLQYMQAQVEEAQAALARKHMQQQELTDRAEKAEAEKLVMEKKLFEASSKVNALEDSLQKETETRQKVEHELKETEERLHSTTIILKATQKTEVQLTKEAKCLIQTLKNAIADGSKLHETIGEWMSIVRKKNEVTNKFHGTVVELLTAALGEIKVVQEQVAKEGNEVGKTIEDGHADRQRLYKELSSLVSNIQAQIHSLASSTQSQIKDLVQTTSQTAKNVAAGTSSLKDAITNGHKIIVQKTNNTREELAQADVQLKTLSETYDRTSSLSLSNLQSEMNSIIKSLNEGTLQLEQNLISGTQSREELYTFISNVTSEWISQIDGVSQKSCDVASKRCDALTRHLQTIASDTSLSNVHEMLQTQETLIQTVRKNHIPLHQTQVEQLKKQGVFIKESSANQARLKEAFMTTVMSKVRDLISEEFSVVSDDITRRYNDLEKDNISLCERQAQVYAEADELLNKAESNNSDCRENAIAVEKREETMIEEVKRSGKAFKMLGGLAGQQREIASNYAGKTEGGVKSLRDEESKVPRIIDDCKKNNTAIGALFEETVKNTGENVRALGSTSKQMSSLATGTSTRCRETLIQIDEHIETTRQDVMAKAHTLQTVGDEKLQQINSLANAINNNTLTHIDNVTISTNTHDKKLQDLQSSSHTNKEHTVASLSSLISTTSQGFHKSASHNQSTMDNVNTFLKTSGATDTLPPPPDVINHSFSSDLTATPSVDILLNNSSDNRGRSRERRPPLLKENDPPSPGDDDCCTVRSVRTAGSSRSCSASPSLRRLSPSDSSSTVIVGVLSNRTNNIPLSMSSSTRNSQTNKKRPSGGQQATTSTTANGNNNNSLTKSSSTSSKVKKESPVVSRSGRKKPRLVATPPNRSRDHSRGRRVGK